MKRNLLKIKHALLGVILLFGLGANAQEQMLLGWQFFNTKNGGKSVGDEATYGSSVTHVSVQESVLSRGSGLTAYALQTGFSSVPAVLTPTVDAAATGNAYFQFALNPKVNYRVSLSTLNYKVRLSGAWSSPANQPFNYKWQYSLDNGVSFSDAGAATAISAATHTDGVLQTPLALGSIANLQNIGDNVTVIFRLYVWGFTNKVGSGTFAIGRSPSATDYSLSVLGTSKAVNTITKVVNEAYFTDMKSISKGGSSEVIMDKLISTINATPADEDIYMSIYMINHQGVMDALKAAEGRGVNLHIIVDMSRPDSQVANVVSLPLLQANLTKSEIITSINDVSSNAINHHKFVLFSSVQTDEGVLKNVTFQTSHNFTTGDAKKIQDALLFNNEVVYQGFLNNWQTLKLFAASGMRANFNYNTVEDAANGIKLAFFPKIGTGVNTSEDDIVEALNDISDVANAKIRIAMSDWSDSRPAIVDKLIQLRQQGATLEIYAKDAAGAQTKVKLRQLETLGATVRIFNLDEGSAAKFNIHAKMMLIEGVWKGQADAKVIITGSHNYTDGALKTNNEALVILLNSSLFNQYSTYFEGFKDVEPSISIVQFDMATISNSNVESFNSTATTGSIVNAFVNRGKGLKAAGGLSTGFSSSHANGTDYAVTPSTFTDAYNKDEFLQIQFDTKNSVVAQLKKIEWNIRKSSSNAATKYRWYYSIGSDVKENFIPINSTDENFVHNSTAAVQPDIDLSNIANLQNIGANKTVYLRLYVFNAINASSTFGFRNMDGLPGFNLLGDLDLNLDKNLIAFDLTTINSGARTDGNEASLESNINDANFLASTLKRGKGLNVDASSVTLQRGFTSVSTNIISTKEEAEIAGNYFSFEVAPKAGASMSLSELHANLRRSANGGNAYIWKYKINDGPFVEIETEKSFTNTATNGVYQPVIKLESISELQDLKADSVVFRLYVWGFNTANSGTFAIGRSVDRYDLALQVRGSSVAPLPVNLTKFEAKKVNNSVRLNWSTASEQNNAQFEVLRSTDGINWMKLTAVKGAGTTSTVTNYNFTDNTAQNGFNYYQLKQVDFDGKSTLSDVRTVQFNLDATLTLTASYANQKLTALANGFTSGNATVKVYNLNGQLLANQKVVLHSGINQILIPANLQRGLYIVTLYAGKETKSVKVIAAN